MGLIVILLIITLNGILQGISTDSALAGKKFSRNSIVFIKRIGGAVLLFAGITDESDVLKPAIDHVTPVWVTIIITILIIFLIIISIRKYGHKFKTETKKYPQLEYNIWLPIHHKLNVYSQLIYLSAYELFMRAFIINTLNDHLSLIGSILISICINSLSHLPKGKTETIASIPFSAIQACLWVFTGSIIPVIMSHLCVGLVFEYYAMFYKTKKI
jgi:membrane protease YdiL (CAAX protease family)